MFSLVGVGLLALVVGFVVGLLVGRKNPTVADAAAVIANEAKANLKAAVPSQTDQVLNAVKAVVNPPVPPKP